MPMTFNQERHDAIMAKIDANPSCWDQTSWHCGTAHCYAGHAQIMAGKPADDDAARRDARQWLGLTRAQADYLFDPDRALEELRHGVDAEGRTADGFDRYGFNRAGFNRAGFDQDGFGRDGFGRDGFDRDGYNRAGFDRDGYGRDGFDRDGYDRDGLDRDNNPRGTA